ncbi:MAG: DUF4012 domain-containing protein [Parcubacteria group bacterium]|jgi:hypothetical protein
MQRKNRNFIIFWIFAVIFLTGWYSYWQVKSNKEFGTISSVINFLPMDELKKAKFKTMASFAEYLFEKDGEEKTFMLMFQNNMELRPGGGYIGSFGILKMQDGQVKQLQTHDLSNFDGRVPNGIVPPYPIKEALNVKDWKLRDSNWSPDFPTNAQKADEFYHLGQGQENFAGVIAINSNVLLSFLKVTGPVEIPGYPGTYDSENAVKNLEYQVEKGFYQQGLKIGERKGVMNLLASEIKKKVFDLNMRQKLQLAEIILDDLNRKDIQLYFKDENLESQAQRAQWDGGVDKNWAGDYLMLVDANMGSLKSDYYLRRSFNYTIDLTGDVPKADLKITYNHTAKEKDWMTKDYQTYLRAYVPQSSWLVNSQNLGEQKFGDELGKKYFGSMFTVPLGRTKTVEFSYTLPKVTAENYDLLIQRQSGSGAVTGQVTIIYKSQKKMMYEIDLSKDWKLSENQ